MKITADTNLLQRAILEDDAVQAEDAETLIRRAESIAVPVLVFCEMVWTMRRLYRRSAEEIRNAIEALLQVECVVTDRPAVEAAIEVLWHGARRSRLRDV